MKLSNFFCQLSKCKNSFYVRRSYCSKEGKNSFSKYVFVSESKDIFENLALEDWLYQHYDLTNRGILLLWNNTPAVVIGRHQNPWLESNVKETTSCNIPVVRRNSGGGTVYHDLGNLNLSFLSSRKAYNRVHNLEIIARSLKKEWNVESKINSRSDIMINKKKVSGTASRLSKKNAYHHCTLLVDVNKHLLSKCLSSQNDYEVIKSNATASKPAPTLNLRELNPSINIDRLITVIGREYLSTSILNTDVESRGFYFVNPNNTYFSGLDKRIVELKSWKWIYGRTPNFKILSELQVKQSTKSHLVTFKFEIEHSVLKNIEILSSTKLYISPSFLKHINSSFLGKNYFIATVSQVKEMFLELYDCEMEDCKSNSILE